MPTIRKLVQGPPSTLIRTTCSLQIHLPSIFKNSLGLEMIWNTYILKFQTLMILIFVININIYYLYFVHIFSPKKTQLVKLHLSLLQHQFRYFLTLIYFIFIIMHLKTKHHSLVSKTYPQTPALRHGWLSQSVVCAHSSISWRFQYFSLRPGPQKPRHLHTCVV